MSWEKDIKELKKREILSEKMGGDEKLKRQKDNNRLNVRERIDLLLDKNSFHEIGKIAGKAEYDEQVAFKKFSELDDELLHFPDFTKLEEITNSDSKDKPS